VKVSEEIMIELENAGRLRLALAFCALGNDPTEPKETPMVSCKDCLPEMNCEQRFAEDFPDEPLDITEEQPK